MNYEIINGILCLVNLVLVLKLYRRKKEITRTDLPEGGSYWEDKDGYIINSNTLRTKK